MCNLQKPGPFKSISLSQTCGIWMGLIPVPTVSPPEKGTQLEAQTNRNRPCRIAAVFQFQPFLMFFGILYLVGIGSYSCGKQGRRFVQVNDLSLLDCQPPLRVVCRGTSGQDQEKLLGPWDSPGGVGVDRA